VHLGADISEVQKLNDQRLGPESGKSKSESCAKSAICLLRSETVESPQSIRDISGRRLRLGGQPITPLELREAAKRAYGPVGWQKRLAADLGVDTSTIRRWLARSIPQRIALAIERLTAQHG